MESILIEIKQGKNLEPLVSARDLYKALDLKHRFSDWIKQNLLSNFIEGVDFTSVSTSTLVITAL